MIKQLKKLVRKSIFVTHVVAFLYNMLFSNCRLPIILGKISAKGVFLRGTKIILQGRNNRVILGAGSSLNFCKIFINGNKCCFELGGGKISEAVIFIEDDKSSVFIGKDFTMGSGHIAATEGKSITIGNDCMFSDDIEIRNGDSHSIYDEECNRINNAKEVRIGNHVWITAHARILKGSLIPDGSVIANSCIVTSQLDVPNSIYGGVPVRLLKSDISWKRTRN